MFLVGVLTVAQFSFWGNYLPVAYPVHLRGTGESFAANVGGRMLGTSFALLTTTLATNPGMQGFWNTYAPGSTPPTRLAYAAAAVVLFVYVAGFLMSFFLPEPKQEAVAE
jgi:hypothetical protein